MKLRKYMVRIVVGATAFLFSVGIYTTWQYARAAPSAMARTAQTETPRLPEIVAASPLRADVASPMPAPADTTEAAKFDAEGYYYIAGEKTPKGFEDFENFSIVTKDYKTENEDDYGKLIAPQGYVQTKRDIKFSRISIGNNQLQFETERVKGISYSFSGEFTETRNFNYLESEAVEKVLKGVLIKNRDGRKIAEASGYFGWFLEMGCGC